MIQPLILLAPRSSSHRSTLTLVALRSLLNYIRCASPTCGVRMRLASLAMQYAFRIVLTKLLAPRTRLPLLLRVARTDDNTSHPLSNEVSPIIGPAAHCSRVLSEALSLTIACYSYVPLCSEACSKGGASPTAHEQYLMRRQGYNI